MLATGNTNFVDYVNSSMLSNEIGNQLERLENENKDLVDQRNKKENSLQYLKTPLEILKEHHLDECALIMAPKKKKKILGD